MSTLPNNAPFIKKFMNGDHGWAHAAQEFGVYAITTSIAGWLVSPILAAAIVAVLVSNVLKVPYVGDKFWFDREIKQSLNMKRVPSKSDLRKVPDKPTGYWTKDAIEDVKFPRKMRKPIIIAAAAYCFLQFKIVGIFGLLIPY